MKIITDYTKEERQQMTSEERKQLRRQTHQYLKDKGYYDNALIMSEDQTVDISTSQGNFFYQSGK